MANVADADSITIEFGGVSYSVLNPMDCSRFRTLVMAGTKLSWLEYPGPVRVVTDAHLVSLVRAACEALQAKATRDQ